MKGRGEARNPQSSSAGPQGLRACGHFDLQLSKNTSDPSVEEKEEPATTKPNSGLFSLLFTSLGETTVAK